MMIAPVLAALSFEQTALLLAWVAIVLLGFALAGLMQQLHMLTHNVDGHRFDSVGPRIGSTVPQVPGVAAGSEALLLFADVGCGSCDRSVEQLERAALRRPDSTAFVVLYRDAGPQDLDLEATTVVRHAQQHFAAAGVGLTPSAAIIDRDDRIIDATPVGSPDLLDALLERLHTGVRQ